MTGQGALSCMLIPVRTAACATPVSLADPAGNAESLLQIARACGVGSTVVVAFPELAFTSYSMDDLCLQDAVLDAPEAAIERIVQASHELGTVLVFGAPLRYADRVYNIVVVVHRRTLLSVVPKVHLPNYREFYKRLYFASGGSTEGGEVRTGQHVAPFHPDLLSVANGIPELVVHAEIGEALWIPTQPISPVALSGTTILVNRSNSNITVGKADTRRMLCQAQSAQCIDYLCTATGEGVSTTDLAWDGQTSIFENGSLLSETTRFGSGPRIAAAEIHADCFLKGHARHPSFERCQPRHAERISLIRQVRFSSEFWARADR